MYSVRTDSVHIDDEKKRAREEKGKKKKKRFLGTQIRRRARRGRDRLIATATPRRHLSQGGGTVSI